MKKTIIGAALALTTLTAQAIQPYVAGDKVAGGDLKAAMTAAEQKLTAAGFTVVGRHLPKGLPQHGSVVVTDAGLSEAMRAIGGNAVVGVPIRVGVQADGTLSYVNLEYWERAYLRKDYGKAEGAVKATAAKLGKTLGAGKAFGGDVPEAKLAKYQYMFGMEDFDDRNDLKDYPNFDAAVKAVEANLARGVAHTVKVYQVVMADKKLAVFGVTMNDPDVGEGWWMKKIGADHIAGMPWEVYVVDGKVHGLYGRFRTALAWPELGMGQFMGISNHPDTTKKMLEAVAGVEAK